MYQVIRYYRGESCQDLEGTIGYDKARAVSVEWRRQKSNGIVGRVKQKRRGRSFEKY